MTTISVPGGTTIQIRDIGSGIEQSTNSMTQSALNFPVIVENTTAGGKFQVQVIFSTDITLTTINDYFICGSGSLIIGSATLNIDGTRPIITIQNVANYPGLIQNGTDSQNGYNTILIQNLLIRATGSTNLAFQGGWIGQRQFGKNGLGNVFRNCTSDGDISDLGGGIVGANAAMNNGDLQITVCTSSGFIGSLAGGILGNEAGLNGGIINIIRSSSTGDISAYGGGIAGKSAAKTNGTVNITNCYSTGTISFSGGGIFGQSAGEDVGTCNAVRCQSTGNIDASSGGIQGDSPGLNGGNTTASNCQTTGTINSSGGGGGIYGNNGTLTSVATNCYTSGAVTGSTGGIQANSSDDNLQGFVNYSEGNHGSSGWNDTHANYALDGVPLISNIGTFWTRVGSLNTPYVLSFSGYTPQSIDLVTIVNQTIPVGGSSYGGIVPGYTYSIITINDNIPSTYPYISINPTTGVISTTLAISEDTYAIVVYSTKNPQSFTEQNLIVSGAPPIPVIETLEGPVTPIPCCSLPMDFSNADQRTINEMISGNTQIGQSNRPIQTAIPSYSFQNQKQMAQAAKR